MDLMEKEKKRKASSNSPPTFGVKRLNPHPVTIVTSLASFIVKTNRHALRDRHYVEEDSQQVDETARWLRVEDYGLSGFDCGLGSGVDSVSLKA